MNESRQPRKLNTGSAAGRSSAPTSSGRKINRSSAPSQSQEVRHTYHASSSNAGRSAQQPRSGQPRSAQQRTAQSRPAQQRTAQSRSAQPAAHHSAPKNHKKKNGLKTALLSLLGLVVVLCVGLFGLYTWVVKSISPEGGTPSLNQLINTPTEYKGDVVNILVCGIDKDDSRDYGAGSSSNDGMTDMIMYVNFDVKNKKINMMQIPRDTYVGEEYNTGKTGRINAVALRNEGGIADLAKAISEQYRVPIDYYVTINMQALREVVDHFGGIEVYVPEHMEYDGSKLDPGLQTLDGNAVEFFVRNRKTYAQGDIKRLDMQRYFYQGLFNRIRTATVWDLAKLMPVAMNYITTDIPGDTLVSLGVSFLKVDSANIMMCKVPTFSAAQRYNGNSIQICDTGKTLDLINNYFLTYTTPVESLNVPTLATAGQSSEPNIQYMGQLDTEAGVVTESPVSDTTSDAVSDAA